MVGGRLAWVRSTGHPDRCASCVEIARKVKSPFAYQTPLHRQPRLLVCRHHDRVLDALSVGPPPAVADLPNVALEIGEIGIAEDEVLPPAGRDDYVVIMLLLSKESLRCLHRYPSLELMFAVLGGGAVLTVYAGEINCKNIIIKCMSISTCCRQPPPSTPLPTSKIGISRGDDDSSFGSKVERELLTPSTPLHSILTSSVRVADGPDCSTNSPGRATGHASPPR